MIERWLDHAFDWLVVCLGLVFIAAVCLNFVNVVGRYAFGRAIFGADEVQTYIMVWMAFAGAAAVSWRNAHLRMDVLTARLPQRVRSVLRVLELVLIAVTAAIVLWQSLSYCLEMARMGRRSDAAGIPMEIPHSAVAFGFGLIALIALWRLLRGEPEAGADSSPS